MPDHKRLAGLPGAQKKIGFFGEQAGQVDGARNQRLRQFYRHSRSQMTTGSSIACTGFVNRVLLQGAPLKVLTGTEPLVAIESASPEASGAVNPLRETVIR
jgi:hypothetical protein